MKSSIETLLKTSTRIITMFLLSQGHKIYPKVKLELLKKMKTNLT